MEISGENLKFLTKSRKTENLGWPSISSSIFQNAISSNYHQQSIPTWCTSSFLFLSSWKNRGALGRLPPTRPRGAGSFWMFTSTGEMTKIAAGQLPAEHCGRMAGRRTETPLTSSSMMRVQTRASTASASIFWLKSRYLHALLSQLSLYRSSWPDARWKSSPPTKKRLSQTVIAILDLKEGYGDVLRNVLWYLEKWRYRSNETDPPFK